MESEKRFYKASQQPISHVSIRSSLAEDLYVVLEGQDADSGKAIIQVFLNPLVMWVWIGGIVVFLGTLLALIPSREDRELAQAWQAQEEAVGGSRAALKSTPHSPFCYVCNGWGSREGCPAHAQNRR